MRLAYGNQHIRDDGVIVVINPLHSAMTHACATVICLRADLWPLPSNACGNVVPSVWPAGVIPALMAGYLVCEVSLMSTGEGGLLICLDVIWAMTSDKHVAEIYCKQKLKCDNATGVFCNNMVKHLSSLHVRQWKSIVYAAQRQIKNISILKTSYGLHFS